MEQIVHYSLVAAHFLSLIKMMAQFWVKINYWAVVHVQSGQINL